jgi:hypothetical protein
LQDAGPSGEVLVGMDLLPIGGEEEQRGGRHSPDKGPVVTNIGPKPRLPGSGRGPRAARRCRHRAVAWRPARAPR